MEIYGFDKNGPKKAWLLKRCIHYCQNRGGKNKNESEKNPTKIGGYNGTEREIGEQKRYRMGEILALVAGRWCF